MRDQGKPIGGTQSISRALHLLKSVAASHPAGATLTDLLTATGLERATAHRIASSLVEAGFVQRDSGKRYRLGIEAMQLGLAAMTRAPLLDAVRPAIQAIARRTEDTVYLVARNGDYSHTLHREEGAFPIKTFTSIVGTMRLLGMGAGAQALMALLSEDEMRGVHQRHRDDYIAKGLSILKLHEIMRRTRRNGYAVTEALIAPGVVAVGQAFQVTSSSHAAVSVAAIRQRMSPERRKWVAEVIAEDLSRVGFKTVDALPA